MLPALVTVAVKTCPWQGSSVAVAGLMEMATAGGDGAVTVTAAEALLVGSAWLTATTWQVPATLGAV